MKLDGAKFEALIDRLDLREVLAGDPRLVAAGAAFLAIETGERNEAGMPVVFMPPWATPFEHGLAQGLALALMTEPRT